MTTLDTLIPKWNTATANLPWGVQHQFYETLKLVEEDQIHLVHGTDYAGNMPCLVNANAQVLGILDGVGGTGKPSSYFGEVVSTFDQINAEMKNELGYTGNYVHSITASLLLKHFGTLKPEEQETHETHQADLDPVGHQVGLDEPYREPTDAELMTDWMTVIKKEVPNEQPEHAKNVSSESSS